MYRPVVSELAKLSANPSLVVKVRPVVTHFLSINMDLQIEHEVYARCFKRDNSLL